MNIDTLNHKFLMTQHRVELLAHNTEELLLQPELLGIVLDELSTALEELQVQQEELLSTRGELESEREFYQDLFEFAPNGYLVTDPQGVIQKVNQAVAKLFQVRQDFLIGKPLIVFVAEADRRLFSTRLNELGELKQLKNWKINLQPRNGQVFPAALTISTINDPQDHFIGLRWMILDLSQDPSNDQQMTNELLCTKYLKNKFLRTINHELLTPLNPILGMTEALEKEVFGTINERQRKALLTIDYGAKELLRLINNMLDLAKLEERHQEIEYTLTVIDQLCQSSLTFIAQQARQKDIQLEMKIQANLPDLWLDQKRIRQVLIDLLSNAVKFTLRGGRITLEVTGQEMTSPEGYIRFAVIDTGIGIAPENLNKLFQPFSQIDSALNRKYDGAGLELALVKQIVESHNGKVGVTSEVGVGSCFTVDLPYFHSREKTC